MDTAELKHIIIERLSHIDDLPFLHALKTIVESKASSDTYKLGDFQKKRIDLARQDLRNGQSITHEDLQNELDLWLNAR